MARRPLPPSQGTKRRAAFIAQAPVVLIVCEGKTEAKLLNELRARWRIPTSTIKLVPQAGVPSTVVREANPRNNPLLLDIGPQHLEPPTTHPTSRR